MKQSKLPYAKCWECPLAECAVVPPSGSYKNSQLVVIGEAPGAHEVEQGKPFVGPSGVLLNYALQQAGVDPNNVFKTNVVACRPPNNREPDFIEVEACRGRLLHELEQTTAPVLALGKSAAEALDMTSYDRGQRFQWNDRQAMHTYHPAYVLREPDKGSTLLKDISSFVRPPIEVNPEWTNPKVRHITEWIGLKVVLDKIPDNTWVAFDIETDQVRWYQRFDGKPPDPILMLQLAWEQYGYIHNVVIDDVMLYDVPETRDILNEFFPRVRTVAHNGKFDVVFLASHIGVKPRLDFDTMLAHAILDENAKHGLKELVKEIYNIPDYEDSLIKQYLRTRNDFYSKIPFEPLAKYGVIDVIMTLQLRKLFEEMLIAQGRYEWPFMNVIMRGANAFVNIELRGIQIDTDYIQWALTFLEAEMAKEAKAACESVGVDYETFNMNSTQQVATIVYDKLGLPPPRSRKLPPRSTNHEAMVPHAGKHPFIDHLLAYRRVAKMKSSYADNIIESLDINGRVHATFVLQGTEVGRLSARNPALQTIPRPDDIFGALIRGAFVAKPGHVLLIVDYSQAELRVVAAEAMEPFLFDVYENDRDLHSEVAIAMYGPNYTKAQRVRCKMFNFSYVYGGSEYSFARDAGLPLTEAQKFVRDYNRTLPKLAEYRKNQFDKLDKQGYVQSRFGRRRNFPIITKANMDEARKAAVHAPVAGTASDLTLLSGCRLEEEGYEVVLMVHDSVLLEVPEYLADEIAEHAVEIMEETGRTYLPEVKWKADPEVRLRWCDPPMQYQKTQLIS